MNTDTDARAFIQLARDQKANDEALCSWLSGLLALAGHRMVRIDDYLRDADAIEKQRKGA